MDHPRRDSYLLTTLPILKPSLRHEEGAIDASVTFGIGIAQEYSYLTVGDLAQGAAVLAGHPSRMLPLFDESSLIHHQDSVRIPNSVTRHWRKSSRTARWSQVYRSRTRCIPRGWR